MSTTTRVFAYFLLVMFALTMFSLVSNCVDDAAKTTQKEFSASALLAKYEMFKDLSASIDKKRADIEMYQSEINSLSKETEEDKLYLNQKKSELIGIISIHNQLCAEYNSAMSKFNYRFTNAGDLPETNLEPLPREIKPYINSLN